jgi:hypothetical protein
LFAGIATLSVGARLSSRAAADTSSTRLKPHAASRAFRLLYWHKLHLSRTKS